MSDDPLSPRSLPNIEVQKLHMWVSVVPSVVIALVACVTVTYVVVAPTAVAATVIVLVAAGLLTLLTLVGAVLAAWHATTRIFQAVHYLRSLNAKGHQDLQQGVELLNTGKRLSPPAVDNPPSVGGDPLALLAYELWNRSMADQGALAQVAPPVAAADAGGQQQQQIEVFTNVARRMQSLVHREISLLDKLEDQVEDPELLKGLFTIDHLATRMRRQSESLAVLGGATSRRQWSKPVGLYEVLRSAVAEVEHYSRVKVVHPVSGNLDGSAVVDVIHLLAELIENASKFSPPSTQVTLRAEHVGAGIAVEIEDRGLGMHGDERQRVNALLADPDRIDLGELLRDGRIGLYVVAILARKHEVRIELRSNVFGGTQAVVVLPNALVGASAEDAARQQPGMDQQPRHALADKSAPVQVSSVPAAPDSTRGENALPRRGGSAGPSSESRETNERPPLPERQVQTHMAPQLRHSAAPRTNSNVAEEEAHTPGLMAAFQHGFNSAD